MVDSSAGRDDRQQSALEQLLEHVGSGQLGSLSGSLGSGQPLWLSGLWALDGSKLLGGELVCWLMWRVCARRLTVKIQIEIYLLSSVRVSTYLLRSTITVECISYPGI
jgi:hypothetical protein